MGSLSKEISSRKLSKAHFAFKLKLEEHQDEDLLEVAVAAETAVIARDALWITETIHRDRYPEIRLEFVVVTIDPEQE